MKKKKKKQGRYIFRNKEFNTFKEMRTFAYFNMGIGIEEEVWEIDKDQIMKTYKLIKQERRLLCTKTYDAIEECKEYIKKQQLRLF